MGRHKNNCQCERCLQKLKNSINLQNEKQQPIVEEQTNSSNQEIIENIIKDIPEPAQNVEDKILLNDTPGQETIENKTIEFKDNQDKDKLNLFVDVYSDIIEFTFNSIFIRLNWDPLNPSEREILVQALGKVYIKYSDVQFKYMEEVNLAIILFVILFNRYKRKKEDV